MTRRHYDELARLTRSVFGEDLSDDTLREVHWRGWVGRGPAGWLLTATGLAELEAEARRRAEALELARRRG